MRGVGPCVERRLGVRGGRVSALGMVVTLRCATPPRPSVVQPVNAGTVPYAFGSSLVQFAAAVGGPPWPPPPPSRGGRRRRARGLPPAARGRWEPRLQERSAGSRARTRHQCTAGPPPHPSLPLLVVVRMAV